MKPGRRQEGDETTHEGFGGEREGCALLRGVLVASVSEATKTRLRHRPPRPITGQTLEALSVVAVHRRVGMQGKALQHCEPSSWVVSKVPGAPTDLRSLRGRFARGLLIKRGQACVTEANGIRDIDWPQWTPIYCGLWRRNGDCC